MSTVNISSWTACGSYPDDRFTYSLKSLTFGKIDAEEISDVVVNDTVSFLTFSLITLHVPSTFKS